MRRYFAAPGSPFSDEDAAIIGPELERIARERGATPDEIVREAEDPASPLHEHFDWNDETAAEKWRRRQARKLAGSIMVNVQDKSGGYRTVRAFYSVAVSTDFAPVYRRRRAYVEIGTVKSSPVLGEQVIQNALSALMSWAREYEDYRQTLPAFGDRFAPVFDAIQEVDEEVA